MLYWTDARAYIGETTALSSASLIVRRCGLVWRWPSSTAAICVRMAAKATCARKRNAIGRFYWSPLWSGSAAARMIKPCEK